MKTINKFKSVALVACAILFGAFQGESQTTPISTSDYTSISLPFTTLAYGTTTNLASGWNIVMNLTNVTQVWNITNGTFSYSTNVVSSTNTTYANFDAHSKSKVPIQFEFTGPGTSNYVATVARSVTGGNYDTANNTKVTNSCAGVGTNVIAVATIDMTGFNYGRIVSFQWYETNTTYTLTNQLTAASNKRN